MPPCWLQLQMRGAAFAVGCERASGGLRIAAASLGAGDERGEDEGGEHKRAHSYDRRDEAREWRCERSSFERVTAATARAHFLFVSPRAALSVRAGVNVRRRRRRRRRRQRACCRTAARRPHQRNVLINAGQSGRAPTKPHLAAVLRRPKRVGGGMTEAGRRRHTDARARGSLSRRSPLAASPACRAPLAATRLSPAANAVAADKRRVAKTKVPRAVIIVNIGPRSAQSERPIYDRGASC